MQISVLFVVLASASGYANGVEGCCVEPDLAAVFMKNSYLSRELPADFPIGAEVPDGFELIGSHQWFHQHRTVVAWRTNASVTSARGTFRELLQRNGWGVLPSQPLPEQSRPGGFVAEQPQSEPQVVRLCNDNYGQLGLDVWTSAAGTAVSLSLHRNADGRTNCKLVARYGYESLGHYLPTLRLPTGIVIIEGNGRGSSSRQADANVVAETNLKAGQLLDHFYSQMQDQGWAYDTAFDGTEAHGSIWRRTIDDRLHLCMLRIIDQDRRMKLRMTVEVI
jgi:hypothetical protein